jgi:predicted peptidase
MAYEPKLKSGESFPLLIWLHGQGEGGVDTDITLLGNEVVALARPEIQSHFSINGQKGLYVLAVPTPTYWMDEGDGTNGASAGDSRYTEILMDIIKNYVASTPAVDTNRIYLAGCSNGGYMTINLAISNPGYFAALVPQAAAYSYYQYERNADGSYAISPFSNSFIRKDALYFDEEKMLALKEIPMWFIHAANDSIVNPKDYSLPIYKTLLDSGAENKWFSYFESVEGTDMKGVSYLGHLSWIYFFKDQVSGVQNISAIKSAKDLSGFSPSNKGKGGTSAAKVSKKTYHNIFDWLNDQKKA